jgi:hypothetical protein
VRGLEQRRRGQRVERGRTVAVLGDHQRLDDRSTECRMGPARHRARGLSDREDGDRARDGGGAQELLDRGAAVHSAQRGVEELEEKAPRVQDVIVAWRRGSARS